jgi:hypothetical protein
MAKLHVHLQACASLELGVENSDANTNAGPSGASGLLAYGWKYLQCRTVEYGKRAAA